VLAYSGGSRHLGDPAAGCRRTYRCEGRPPSPPISARARSWGRRARKAELLGASEIFVDDLREEFVRDFVFPMCFAPTRFNEGHLPSRHLDRAAIDRPSARSKLLATLAPMAVAHGATGKGNDQGPLRAQLLCTGPRHQGRRTLGANGISLRAPRLLDYAEKHQIFRSPRTKRGEAPFLGRRQTWCTSRPRGKVALRIRGIEPEEFVFSPHRRPRRPPPTSRKYVEIAFERGDPIAVRRRGASPRRALADAVERGRRKKATGIGRLDLVENRFVSA